MEGCYERPLPRALRRGCKVCSSGSMTFIFIALSVSMISRFYAKALYKTIYLIPFHYMMKRSLTTPIISLNVYHIL